MAWGLANWFLGGEGPIFTTIVVCSARDPVRMETGKSGEPDAGQGFLHGCLSRTVQELKRTAARSTRARVAREKKARSGTVRQITGLKVGSNRGPERKKLFGRARRRAAAVLVGSAGLVLLAGCNADSFFDPSVLGYWENTPTTMPILDRI